MTNRTQPSQSPGQTVQTPYGDETRNALIAAATRLIAEQGLAGASLRSINVAAGGRNASAAHLHFRTKTAMVAQL